MEEPLLYSEMMTKLAIERVTSIMDSTLKNWDRTVEESEPSPWCGAHPPPSDKPVENIGPSKTAATKQTLNCVQARTVLKAARYQQGRQQSSVWTPGNKTPLVA